MENFLIFIEIDCHNYQKANKSLSPYFNHSRKIRAFKGIFSVKRGHY